MNNVVDVLEDLLSATRLDWKTNSMRIAWWLPRRVVYWAFVRVLAHATTGKWATTVAPSLTWTDALKRWEE